MTTSEHLHPLLAMACIAGLGSGSEAVPDPDRGLVDVDRFSYTSLWAYE